MQCQDNTHVQACPTCSESYYHNCTIPSNEQVQRLNVTAVEHGLGDLILSQRGVDARLKSVFGGSHLLCAH